MTWRFDYRRWDGSQESLADDADAVLSQLTDDLLANGDLHEALQRMLNRGWQTPDGERVQGLRDLLDQQQILATLCHFRPTASFRHYPRAIQRKMGYRKSG